MASKIKVDQIEGSTGSSITIPSGQTLTITDGLAASTIGSGTLADARIPNLNASKINAGTLPVARGGTGLTSLGTAGQVIKVNSGANALEFGTAAAGGKVLQVVTNHDNTEKQMSTGTTMTNYSELNTSITPSATSSKILIIVSFGALQYGRNDSSLGYGKVMYQISGGSVQDFGGSEQLGSNASGIGGKHQFAVNLGKEDWQVDAAASMCFLHEPNTTTSTSYQVFFQAESGTGIVKINRNHRDAANDCSTISTMTLMEIGA